MKRPLNGQARIVPACPQAPRGRRFCACANVRYAQRHAAHPFNSIAHPVCDARQILATRFTLALAAHPLRTRSTAAQFGDSIRQLDWQERCLGIAGIAAWLEPSHACQTQKTPNPCLVLFHAVFCRKWHAPAPHGHTHYIARPPTLPALRHEHHPHGAHMRPCARAVRGCARLRR